MHPQQGDCFFAAAGVAAAADANSAASEQLAGQQCY